MSANRNSIEPYRNIAPRGTVDFLLRLASRVQGRRFVHVNSTREGGGVAEILNRLVPIMRDLGIKTDWEVIEGDSDFYATTKAFHNALQGKEQVLTAVIHTKNGKTVQFVIERREQTLLAAGRLLLGGLDQGTP